MGEPTIRRRREATSNLIVYTPGQDQNPDTEYKIDVVPTENNRIALYVDDLAGVPGTIIVGTNILNVELQASTIFTIASCHLDAGMCLRGDNGYLSGVCAGLCVFPIYIVSTQHYALSGLPLSFRDHSGVYLDSMGIDS